METPINQIARIERKLSTRNSARVLSALGHPGYGEKFAEKVLQDWAFGHGGFAPLHSVIERNL